MTEQKFVDGLIPSYKHEKAPDFIKFQISVKREELLNWLAQETDEWINIDVKESKKGKLYAQVNTYKKEDVPPITEEQDDIPIISYDDLKMDDGTKVPF